MILENEIDLISVATESGNHFFIALDLIKNGLNVIVEKPLALSIDEANLLVKTSHDNNVKVCVCHQNRFNVAIQKFFDTS